MPKMKNIRTQDEQCKLLLLKTKNTQKNETRRLGFIDSVCIYTYVVYEGVYTPSTGLSGIGFSK